MSLRIGQYIAFALGADNAPELSRLTGGRIAPVVQPEDDQNAMPYVWYYSDGLTEESTKDGHLSDVCTVQIEVVAPTYAVMLSLLQMVRTAMDEAIRAWDGPFGVADQSMTAGPEEYDDTQQAYCRRLIYNIETYE